MDQFAKKWNLWYRWSGFYRLDVLITETVVSEHWSELSNNLEQYKHRNSKVIWDKAVSPEHCTGIHMEKSTKQ